MNLESQVCSLEHAKKLKELGFKQDSLFYWYKESVGDYEAEIRRESDVYDWGGEKDYRDAHKDKEVKKMCSAYTVAELGEMFDDGDLFVKAYGEVFNFRGTARIGELGILNLMKNPDMSAKMLIWLVENKHLNPKEGE